MRIITGCITILLFLSFLASHRVHAEEYTLNDLYRITLERSEVIKLARENITFSEWEKGRAFSALLPRLSAFTSYRSYTEEESSLTQYLDYTFENLIQPKSLHLWGLRADETLSLSFREVTGVLIARNGIRKSTYDLSAQQENYLLQVAQAYYNALMAKKGLDIAQSNLERVSRYRDAAASRMKVGEVTQTVLLRAESELSGARSDVVKARNAYTYSTSSLARLVGIDTGFTLKEEQKHEERAASLADLKSRAYNQRPDLKSSEYQMKMARQQVTYARGAYWPNLVVSGVYERTDQDPESPVIYPDSTYGSLSLSFPFFEGGLRRAEVQQAKVRERQAILQYDDLKKTVGLEVESAYLDLITRKGTLEFLQAQVAFAQDNYRGVSRQFTEGLSSSIDVIDANNLLVSSEMRLAEAEYSYQLAILAVERAIGTFMSEIQGKAKTKD